MIHEGRNDLGKCVDDVGKFGGQVYHSGSDDELPGGLCPCMPPMCFIYKGIVSKLKKPRADPMALCPAGGSGAVLSPNLAFLMSEIQEVEELLTTIENDTNVKHKRSRAKLQRLKQEILEAYSTSSENHSAMDSFIAKINAYKKKLIIVNLENHFKDTDISYECTKWPPASDQMKSAEKLSAPHYLRDTSTAVRKGMDNVISVRKLNWPWKRPQNTGVLGKQEDGISSCSRDIQEGVICGFSRDMQHVEISSEAAQSSMDSLNRQKPGFFPLLETEVQIADGSFPPLKNKRVSGNAACQTSKANVNQGVSAQSLFLKQADSFQQKGGFNPTFGISRSVSVQSSLLPKREETTQTVHRKGGGDSGSSADSNDVATVSSEGEFLTSNSCMKKVGASSKRYSRYDLNSNYSGDSSEQRRSGSLESHGHDENSRNQNKNSAPSDVSLWYISAKKLCDEMFEKNIIVCR